MRTFLTRTAIVTAFIAVIMLTIISHTHSNKEYHLWCEGISIKEGAKVTYASISHNGTYVEFDNGSIARLSPAVMCTVEVLKK